jgi:sporulation protein YlmC with PRC-barrel domain
MITEEAAMSFESDNHSERSPSEIVLPNFPGVPGRHRSWRTRGLLMTLVAVAVIGLLIDFGQDSGLSQGIQLVKVDVQVVANGYRVSKLTGQTVVNDKNEKIGKIDDFVVGRDEGHTLFTVLQVGGFLGIGSHLVAVPYDSLTINDNGNKIELAGASKDQLKQLSQFQYGS